MTFITGILCYVPWGTEKVSYMGTKMLYFLIYLCCSLIDMFILPDRSNRTLYDDVSLVPLPADYQPTVEQLPGTGTGVNEGKMRDGLCV